jgi:hypothetical protein
VKSFKKSEYKAALSKHAPLLDQGRCANCLEITEGVTSAMVRDCTLMGGSEISGGSCSYFKNCSIVDGVVNGVYVNASKILMEDCEIARHDSANVAVENSNDAVFLNCKIYGSKSTGAYLFNKGCALFERCDFFGNVQTGIQIEGDGTDPIIRQNRIHHGEQYGIFVTNKVFAFLLLLLFGISFFFAF